MINVHNFTSLKCGWIHGSRSVCGR